MPWKPSREVRVKTRAELEQAMRSADRIVVDGDASLAAYAASLAAGGPFEAPPAPEAARLRPLGDLERAAHAPRTDRPPRLWPWVAGAGLLMAGAAAALLREHFSRADAVPAATLAPDFNLLMWPALAVVVLLGMFFALRQATEAMDHAPASWRTEAAPAAAGRLIITKVRRPAH